MLHSPTCVGTLPHGGIPVTSSGRNGLDPPPGQGSPPPDQEMPQSMTRSPPPGKGLCEDRVYSPIRHGVNIRTQRQAEVFLAVSQHGEDRGTPRSNGRRLSNPDATGARKGPEVPWDQQTNLPYPSLAHVALVAGNGYSTRDSPRPRPESRPGFRWSTVRGSQYSVYADAYTLSHPSKAAPHRREKGKEEKNKGSQPAARLPSACSAGNQHKGFGRGEQDGGQRVGTVGGRRHMRASRGTSLGGKQAQGSPPTHSPCMHVTPKPGQTPTVLLTHQTLQVLPCASSHTPQACTPHPTRTLYSPHTHTAHGHQ